MFYSLLIRKCIRRSHLSTVNKTKYAIVRYDTFNSKVFPDEQIFWKFNDQPIPYDYYNFLNYDDDDGNNITGNPIDNALPDNEGVGYAVVPNYEGIKNKIIIYDDDSLDPDIEPLQN